MKIIKLLVPIVFRLNFLNSFFSESDLSDNQDASSDGHYSYWAKCFLLLFLVKNISIKF